MAKGRRRVYSRFLAPRTGVPGIPCWVDVSLLTGAESLSLRADSAPLPSGAQSLLEPAPKSVGAVSRAGGADCTEPPSSLW